MTASPRMRKRNCSGRKPASRAPPETVTRPPPSRPVSDSICAWSALKRTTPLMPVACKRSSVTSVANEALASVAVPVTCGSSCGPVTLDVDAGRARQKVVRRELDHAQVEVAPHRQVVRAARGERVGAAEDDVGARPREARPLEGDLRGREQDDERLLGGELHVLDLDRQLVELGAARQPCEREAFLAEQVAARRDLAGGGARDADVRVVEQRGEERRQIARRQSRLEGGGEVFAAEVDLARARPAACRAGPSSARR